MRPLFLAPLLLPALLLSGCALQNTATPALNPAGPAFSGIVHGGQQPVIGATVSLYAVGTTAYGVSSTTPLASTTTDSNGDFELGGTDTSYTCPNANTPIYILAQGSSTSTPANPNLVLLAMLGPCSAALSTTVDINEVTTAAAAYAYNQFMPTSTIQPEPLQIGAPCTSCAGGVYNQGLVNAWYTYNQLVDNATGTAVPSSTSGSLTITTEAAKLNSFANVLAACVNSNSASIGSGSLGSVSDGCQNLATFAGPADDTLEAAEAMVRAPYSWATELYDLTSATPPFPGLSTAPSDWTLAISYNTTALGLGINQGTTTNLDIDFRGNIWFPSNKSGAVGIASFSPSTTSFSAVTGASALTDPQYIAIDTAFPAFAWTTDLASDDILGVPTSTGSALSATAGTSPAFTTGGPLFVDGSDNVVFAATNSSAYDLYYVAPAARSTFLTTGVGAFKASPSTVGMTQVGSPYTSGNVAAGVTTSACFLNMASSSFSSLLNGTGDSSCTVGGSVSGYLSSGGFVVLTTSNNDLIDVWNSLYNEGTSVATLNVPKGIAADGAGVLWVANSGDDSVTPVTPQGSKSAIVFNTVSSYPHGPSNGGTLTDPYGIAVDGSGNVWVSNASCVATTSTPCSPTSFTLTEIVGAAVPAITPIAALTSATYATEPVR